MKLRFFFLAWIFLCQSSSGLTLDDAARSNNEFCFRLIDQNGSKGNQIFSPFSIWSALAMTAAGAEAETLQEMEKVLALPAKGANELVSQWSESLKNASGVKMKIANRLWGRKGLPFRADFLKLTEKQYGAGLEAMDFPGNPDGSREMINHWVSDNTEGRIKDLLGPGAIKAPSRVTLAGMRAWHRGSSAVFARSGTRGPLATDQPLPA